MISVIWSYAAADTACSPDNRNSNLTLCLEGIRDGVQSYSKFWFGIDYQARCPPHLRSTVDCYTPLSDFPYNLESLMFDDFNPSLIDRYLDVIYTSAPGLYSVWLQLFRGIKTAAFSQCKKRDLDITTICIRYSECCRTVIIWVIKGKVVQFFRVSSNGQFISINILFNFRWLHRLWPLPNPWFHHHIHFGSLIRYYLRMLACTWPAWSHMG